MITRYCIEEQIQGKRKASKNQGIQESKKLVEAIGDGFSEV